ncbi:MAG: hypothetical protein JWO90_2255 [Solirubrobacterales bacterium]|jgi:uncharacterized protein YndB with AHSA1/START domain|nr:hypothetical protein [Solirubrobacterales bacterium]
MSTTRKHIAAPPEKVWAILADPDNYAHWVVGSRDIRDADPGFPAVGTRFHHTLAFGPIDLKDSSEVVEAEEPRRLVLHVMARPFGRGKVVMDLARTGDGTHVTMREGPASPLARLTYNPLADLLLHGRNVEALRRLAELAEGEHAEPTTSRNSGSNAGGGEDGPAVGPES